MTRLEKIIMAVLLLLIIGTVVFWNDVSSVFNNKKENVVENEPKKEKKDKRDKDDKDEEKSDKDEANNLIFLNGAAVA